MTDSKRHAITAAILQLYFAGKPLPEALDQVLGAGTFDGLVDDLYTALRAKAGK